MDNLDYYYDYDIKLIDRIINKKNKYNFNKFQEKSQEEILKEHRNINKVLRKSLKKLKINRTIRNNI